MDAILGFEDPHCKRHLIGQVNGINELIFHLASWLHRSNELLKGEKTNKRADYAAVAELSFESKKENKDFTLILR